jgi:hypothetical protein
MCAKIYRLKQGREKFISPANSSPLAKLQQSVNKRRVKKILKAQKRFKRPNPWLHILKLLAFYYGFVAFIVLLSRLGR